MEPWPDGKNNGYGFDACRRHSQSAADRHVRADLAYQECPEGKRIENHPDWTEVCPVPGHVGLSGLQVQRVHEVYNCGGRDGESEGNAF